MKSLQTGKYLLPDIQPFQGWLTHTAMPWVAPLIIQRSPLRGFLQRHKISDHPSRVSLNLKEIGNLEQVFSRMTGISNISDRRRILEIILVIITGLGRILFVNLLGIRYVFLFSAIILWTGYILVSALRDKNLINYWGLSFSNSKTTFKILGIIGIIAFLLILSYGIYYRTLSFNENIILILILYPIWGLIQQFLIMSLFAGNLKDLSSKKIHDVTIILVTSVLFSMVHYPSVPLILATFVMALLYTFLFLKERNILPLGIFHGVLGGMFFYAVLQKDLWFELVTALKKWV